MKQTEKLQLPILQSGDKYTKEIQNEAFKKVDLHLGGLAIRVNNIVASTGESNTEIVDARVDTITGVVHNTLGERMNNVSEQLNNAQKHKLTEDNGLRKYLTENFDILELDTGFYETSLVPINSPLPSTGFMTINVYKNTTGTGTRKQIFVDYNYDKRLFIGNVHTGKKFMGWEEIEYKQGTQLFYEEEKKTLYDLIVKRQNSKTKTFSFISDTHYIKGSDGPYGVNGLNHIKNMIDFANEGVIDIAIHGGDIINGKKSTNVIRTELKDCINVMKKCNYPVAICKGNHDYGVWYNCNIDNPKLSNVLSQDEWFNRMNKPFIHDFVVDENNPTGGYFYKDFKDVKLRVIFINTANTAYIRNSDGSPKYNSINGHAIGGKQIEWLAEKALNFEEEGWKVITFSHVSFFSSDLNSSTVNGYYVSKLLKNLNNNESFNYTGDTEDYKFTINGSFNKNAKHLIHIAGHYHTSEYYENSDGIKFLNVIHSACADKNSGLTKDETVREKGTISEDSWSIITIDTSKNKLYIDMFGAGEDRVLQL